MIPVLHQDPFSPKLFSSESLAVTDEQKMYVKKVLDIASSDSKFSEKAYAAISQILTGGSIKVPVVTSLSPSSAVIGDPDVVLSVHGTDFTSLSVIIFNGGEEPTTFTSSTELKTTINMSTVSGPIVVPVAVLSEDGVLSNTMDFTFEAMTGGVLLSIQVKSPSKEPLTHKEPLTPTKKEEKK